MGLPGLVIGRAEVWVAWASKEEAVSEGLSPLKPGGSDSNVR